MSNRRFYNNWSVNTWATYYIVNTIEIKSIPYYRTCWKFHISTDKLKLSFQQLAYTLHSVIFLKSKVAHKPQFINHKAWISTVSSVQNEQDALWPSVVWIWSLKSNLEYINHFLVEPWLKAICQMQTKILFFLPLFESSSCRLSILSIHFSIIMAS